MSSWTKRTSHFHHQEKKRKGEVKGKQGKWEKIRKKIVKNQGRVEKEGSI